MIELTPYPTVTEFGKTVQAMKRKIKSSEAVFAEIKEKMLSENLFSAVKISGLFKKMHLRADAGTRATLYTFNRFCTRRQPEQLKHTSKVRRWVLYTRTIPWYRISGFHVHFANDDRNFGGHVLDFEVGREC
ncbi:acetolactate decarboxylase [Staphylococcus aureus]